MREIPYFIVDVFTDTQLSGNPLAVFPDTSLLHESELQKIAQQMNLSETVFVFPPEDEAALRRLRIFTPAFELPLAGHPVIGCWYLLASRGLVDFDAAEREKQVYIVRNEELPDKIIFRHELKAGILPVTLFRDKNGDISGVVMDQLKPEFGEEITELETLAETLGLEPGAISRSFSRPMIVSTGNQILIVPLANRNDLTKVKINLEAYERLAKEIPGFKGIYAFTRDATVDTEQAFVSARGFFPEDGIPEDPATGSAAGPLGAYLVKAGILQPKQTIAFQVEQGADMGRPGRIGVEITMADGNVERVRVGGSACVTSEATLYLPS